MTGDSTISDNLFRIVAIQHNEKRLQALLVPADAFMIWEPIILLLLQLDPF